MMCTEGALAQKENLALLMRLKGQESAGQKKAFEADTLALCKGMEM